MANIAKDLVRIASEISNAEKPSTNSKGGLEFNIGSRMNSISSGASSAIYYFPLLASKNISAKIMALVSNNLEFEYASFVKACFALTPAMNIKENELLNVNDYLELFHQNIGLRDKNSLYVGLKEGITEYNMFPNESLNEATKHNVSGIIDRMSKDPIHYNNNNNGMGSCTSTYSNDRQAHVFNSSEIRICDSQNNMRPTVLEVTAKFVMGGNVIDVQIPVGVKTVIHAVNPSELNDHIMEAISGKGLVHNLIRYTTGELSSLSDILFNTSKIKRYVKSSSDVAKWANALEHRKNMSKIRNAIPFLSKKPYLPNTSIMISMTDVEEINQTVGYDLLKDVNRTVKFMKDNFLLSFVIVDELTETVYVLHDGRNEFEDYPFDAIRRENDKKNSIADTLIKALALN